MNRRNPRTTAATHRTFTWDAFLAEASRRPGADQRCWARESQEGLHGRGLKFFGTATFAEGLDLARTGWPEGAMLITQGLDLEAPDTVPALTPALEHDLAGEWPDVPAYCAGVPEHMVSMGEQQTQQRPVLHLGVIGSLPFSITAQDVTNYGSALLSHILAHQAAGYSVALDWFSFKAGGGEVNGKKAVHCTQVRLLEADGVLDIDRLAFALAHAAMNRRLCWAVIEQDPELSALRHGYGAPQSIAPADLEVDQMVILPAIQDVDTETRASALRGLGRAIEESRKVQG